MLVALGKSPLPPFCNVVANSGSVRSSNNGCSPTLNKETSVAVILNLPVVPALFSRTGIGLQVNLDRLSLVPFGASLGRDRRSPT